jgi:excisionase family DNA binding protein
VPYTLGEAARATGKSKPTIARAIAKGRISATRGPDNQWQIEPVELHRVFPPAGTASHHMVAPVPPHATAALERENALLREVVDDLRRRLDQAEAERREAQGKAVALLEHVAPRASWWRRWWRS